jgi:Mg/Co/Ni transporter MgtE
MALSQKTNLYDCLCAALRKSLSDGGHLALTAALQNQTTGNIAVVIELMTDDEALAIFNWLDDHRAAELLRDLRPERVSYLLHHAPPGRVGKMSFN